MLATVNFGRFRVGLGHEMAVRDPINVAVGGEGLQRLRGDSGLPGAPMLTAGPGRRSHAGR